MTRCCSPTTVWLPPATRCRTPSCAWKQWSISPTSAWSPASWAAPSRSHAIIWNSWPRLGPATRGTPLPAADSPSGSIAGGRYTRLWHEYADCCWQQGPEHWLGDGRHCFSGAHRGELWPPAERHHAVSAALHLSHFEGRIPSELWSDRLADADLPNDRLYPAAFCRTHYRPQVPALFSAGGHGGYLDRTAAAGDCAQLK